MCSGLSAKCGDGESTCARKGKASRRRCEADASKGAGKITSEQSEPKETGNSERHSPVTGNHIIFGQLRKHVRETYVVTGGNDAWSRPITGWGFFYVIWNQ